MEFFFSLMLSPCAVAALVLAMYYVYPKPLIRGFARYVGLKSTYQLSVIIMHPTSAASYHYVYMYTGIKRLYKDNN